MGHLVNPVSVRLSINSFWNSNWVLFNNFNYINIFKKDYLLFYFLDWFTKKQKFGKFNIIISHYKVFRSHENVFINLYYYNAGLEEKKYHFQVFFLYSLLKSRKISFYKNFLRVSTKRLGSIYKYFIRVLLSNLYWYLLKNSIQFYLNKLTLYKNNFYFNVYSLDFFNVNVDTIAAYMSLKLQQRHSLNWVLRPILKDLSLKIKRKIILGYKIVCSGRFTRKQIATYSWVKKGSLHLNSLSSLVKYSEARVRLKYGLCGIKIWLNYGFNNSILFKRSILLAYPLHVPFKYSFDIKNKTIILAINYWFYSYIRILFFKSRYFNLYKVFVYIKTRLLLKHLLGKLTSKYEKKTISIRYLTNNKLKIVLNPSKVNHLALLRKKIYE